MNGIRIDITRSRGGQPLTIALVQCASFFKSLPHFEIRLDNLNAYVLCSGLQAFGHPLGSFLFTDEHVCS